MENIIRFDTSLFLAINHLPHFQAANLFALFLSGIGMLGIVWIALGVILFLREEKKHHWFFTPILLAGASSWIVAEKILKPVFARVRPLPGMGAILVGDGSTDFSFPSGHATIAFAMAYVLSKIEPRWKWLFYVLAVLISLSRIYLGKHFPLDVVAGAVVGWLIGFLSWKFAKYVNHRFKITS